jgi:hypothetical protein
MGCVLHALHVSVKQKSLQRCRSIQIQDLQFHEALYWAAVTITTVGYGDFTPTTWIGQMATILMLLLVFTLLPILSGNLIDALNSTNKYQRARYW